MSGTFLYITAGSFCFGVALALIFPLGGWLILAILLLAAAILVVGLLQKKPTKLMILPIALAALALGILRSDLLLGVQAAETLPHYIDQKVSIAGRVETDPDVRDTSVHVTLGHLSVDGAPVSGKLLVLLDPGTEVSYNDEVLVQGKVVAPQAFQTETNHIFDYPGYLRAQGISAQMSYAKLLAHKPSERSLMGSLFWLKHMFEHSLDTLFPNPDNALLQGIELGEKSGISQQLTDAFIQSGLVHIVVLSGYNIAVVSEAVFRTLSFLPRSYGLGLGGFAMILFALMTGAGSATLRALAMGLIALLARYLRRGVVALRCLVIAAAAMILWNPDALLFDTSFILSVLATFGLITLAPWVESYLAKIKLLRKKSMLGTRSILASTLAVEMFVVPALLYFSGVLSLLSLPANALVLPVIPAAMLWGFVAGMLGLVSPYLGIIPAFIADILLKFILLVVGAIASIPLSSIVVSQFSPWFLVLAYIPLTWFAILKYKSSLASNSRGH